jgi:chorismate mutase/prephenate dehydratase
MNVNPERTLEELRRDIDGIDDQLIELLNRRAIIAREIGKMKTLSQPQAKELRVADREREILERLARVNKGPLSEESVESIFNKIFMECLDVQKNGRGT